MIGNQLEQEIVGLYNADVTALYSINQIAKNLGKAYPYINKKVNSLIDYKILKKTEVGRSHLCTVNLESDRAVWLLVLNEIRKKEKLLKGKKSRKLLDTIENLKEATSIQLVLKSKGEIIAVINDDEDAAILKKSKTLKEHNLKVCTPGEFRNLLLENKALIEDHTIMHGYEKYYQYLREVKGPLRIKHSRLLQ